MKKCIVIIALIFTISKLYAQLDVGASFDYVHTIKPGDFKGRGYTLYIGYSIKEKLDVSINMSYSIWSLSAFFSPALFMIHSYHLNFKYLLFKNKRSVNPYIGIGSGYFSTKETILFIGVDNQAMTKLGVLPSIGALFKLQSKRNQLFADTRLSYCYVNYKYYPLNSINLNLGLIYYFKGKSKTNNG